MSADLYVICSFPERILAALQTAPHLLAYLCNPSTACAWALDKGLHEQTLWLTGNPSAFSMTFRTATWHHHAFDGQQV